MEDRPHEQLQALQAAKGLLDLRHGSGAYLSGRRAKKSRADRMRQAQERVRAVVEKLQRDGLSEDEIQRLVEAELFYPAAADGKRRAQ